ncbi:MULTISPECIES: cytidylyltransferase domain-containing protein [Phyllobacteriaceae]|uniref:Acylneuraminate cytidylyltransferase n=1 Tax=Mesorhizobium hungaricum TaxID=1566387 RepID=A0A1C2DJH4_9HYPH|nr:MULTISPECIES: acylneuraminate cytidylyltransferase family protein [Mesorhizobium]MBN9233210.1 acylneuraminate cytidylyltransferase family protein [Mesorhizobium sp.]MDQ0332103.1 N-acylneuraminate cytidylyltransferase [Mesorhizobium sp. YL-MeA3-2017]OCX14816.1 hypothetical protein QV13_20590 [Mesorhizobium hungaricum]
MKTLAIIPARGGSKRLPGKNIKSFAGVPLIVWSVRFSQSIKWFDRIVVSTDDPEIASVVVSHGLDVPFLRSAELATDTATTVDVVFDVLQRERAEGRSYDFVALLQPTSPVRRAERWEAARMLLNNDDCQAVIGVAHARNHPSHLFDWQSPPSLVPFTDNQERLLRSQDLSPVVYIAGNLYLARTSVLESGRTFFPDKTFGVLCDGPCESIDIDTEDDWIMAEALAQRYGEQP